MAPAFEDSYQPYMDGIRRRVAPPASISTTTGRAAWTGGFAPSKPTCPGWWRPFSRSPATGWTRTSMPPGTASAGNAGARIRKGTARSAKGESVGCGRTFRFSSTRSRRSSRPASRRLPESECLVGPERSAERVAAVGASRAGLARRTLSALKGDGDAARPGGIDPPGATPARQSCARRVRLPSLSRFARFPAPRAHPAPAVQGLPLRA
jgi:hypothetical protein